MKTNLFWQKLVPYVAPGRSTRTKMTANGFSSYELFVKKCDCCCILQYFLPLFMNTHFFILPHLNIVYRGLCVPTSETSCSSYFMKTSIFWKSLSHMWPQPNPLRRKWPQFDSLAMNVSSKSTIFIDFYDVFGNFSWTPTFSFAFI